MWYIFWYYIVRVISYIPTRGFDSLWLNPAGGEVHIITLYLLNISDNNFENPVKMPYTPQVGPFATSLNVRNVLVTLLIEFAVTAILWSQ